MKSPQVPSKLTFSGAWSGISAGGCLNYASWRYNPQLFLKAEQPTSVTITLQQDRDADLWHIGIYVATCPDSSGYRVLHISPESIVAKASFSNQKQVSCVVDIADCSVPLVVIPCTFRPEQESDFRMTFESSQSGAVIRVAPVEPTLEWRMYTQVGKWEQSSAGGCKNYPNTVCNNPQFSVECAKQCTVTVTLAQTSKDPFDSIGVYVCKTRSAGSKLGTPSSELGPGLSPVVRPKQKADSSSSGGGSALSSSSSSSSATVVSSSSSSGGGGSAREKKDDGFPNKAQRVKVLSSKQIIAKSEFSSDKEASVMFKASPKYSYTIIPCTFEPGQESVFTLTCFSKRRLKLKSLNHEAGDIECSGQWHDESAGGCVNFPTWRNNPQYFLYTKRPGVEVRITLQQKRSFEPHAIGIYVAKNQDASQSRLLVLSADNLVGKTSFEKRREVSTTVTLEDVDTPYVIIPATFYANQPSKFTLTMHVESVRGAKEGAVIKASTVLTLLPCTFLWHQRTLKSEWRDPGENGGCRNHPTWLQNPQVALKVAQESKVVIILALPDAAHSVGVYCVKDNRSINQSTRIKEADAVEVVAKSVFRKEEEVALELSLEKGSYKIIPCTFLPGINKTFELSVYCDTDKFSSVLCHDDQEGHSHRLALAADSRSSSSNALEKWRIKWEDVTIDEGNLLGQGGYGVVYKGSYRGEDVAVKKMLVELMEESDLIVFKKEISIMDLYHHPNIVRFVGANLTPPSICILTEYCARGSLSKVLKVEKDLSWALKLKIARQTASGMAFLHAQNPPVVHRDLKSLNILVTADYTAKLCDFGLSKTTSGSSLNSCVGSLNWCAPEVLLRNAPFTKYADVYSMGMVLLELYTHSPPFAGMQPLQIVKAIDSGTSLPIPTACPRAYGLLIRKCWDDIPKNRPPFNQIEQDLEAISPDSFPKNK